MRTVDGDRAVTATERSLRSVADPGDRTESAGRPSYWVELEACTSEFSVGSGPTSRRSSE